MIIIPKGMSLRETSFSLKTLLEPWGLRPGFQGDDIIVVTIKSSQAVLLSDEQKTVLLNELPGIQIK